MNNRLFIWRGERWHRADSSFLPEVIEAEGVESDRWPGFPSLSPDGRPCDGKSGALYRVINEGAYNALSDATKPMYRPMKALGDAGRTVYEMVPPKPAGEAGEVLY